MSSGSGSNNNASNSKRGQSGRRVKIESTSSDADYDTTPDHNFEHGSWECTVCTFRNKSEAFRCEMCDVRKGTSTRKPRLNSTVVEQQQTVQKFVQQQQMAMMAQVQKEKSRDRNSLNPSCQSSLQDIDSPGPSYRSIESPASGASTSLGPQSPCTSKTPTPQPTPPPLVVSSISTSLTPSPTISIPNSNSIVTPLKHHRSNANNKSRRGRGGKNFFLNNLDQNSARTLAVTVNGVTVVITDYKLLTSNETNDNNSSSLKSSDPTVSPLASNSPATAKRTSSSKKKTSSSSSKKRKKLIIADDDDDNAVESSADESNDDKRIKNKKNKKKTFAKPSSCHFNDVDDDEDSNCAT